MPQLSEIIQALESFAPLELQESYDNCGLIVGSFDQSIDAALVCLDCTEAVLEEAIQSNCQLIIAHHPPVFSGLKKISGKKCHRTYSDSGYSPPNCHLCHAYES